MMKFSLVILMMLGLIALVVSTSLADFEDENENIGQPELKQQSRLAAGDDPFAADSESWWRQRSSADNEAMAVDNQLLRVRDMISSNQQNKVSIPETKNYGVVAEPFDCICCCWWCCNSRRRQRNMVEKILPNKKTKDELPEITALLGSETELKLYSNRDDLLRLYQSPVARSELYSRPLDADTSEQVSEALGGRQHAVVATLADGRRFLVVKGNQKGEGSKTIVIIADHMTDDWVKVTSKDVSQSTLANFVKAGGHSFDALQDNGRHAASRMFALP
jgi:hypothetical protein